MILQKDKRLRSYQSKNQDKTRNRLIGITRYLIYRARDDVETTNTLQMQENQQS